MRRRITQTSLLAAAILLAIGAPLSAQVVTVSNLGNSQDSTGFVMPGGSGSSFTTGAGLFDLNSVDLLIQSFGGSGGGTLTYTGHLYTNSGSTPGVEIATSTPSATLPFGVFGGSGTQPLNLDFGSVALAANTTYWFLVTDSPTGTASSSFIITNDDSQSSTFGWTIGDGAFYMPSTSGGQTMLFDVNATVAVPEPSTYALLSLAGLAGFTYYRRKRARSKVVA